MRTPASWIRLYGLFGLVPVADRSIMIAPLVGIVAGLGAIVFHLMSLAVTHYALATAVGYQAGGPANERVLHEVVREVAAPSRPFHPWLLLLVPTVGGLVSGYIVYRFAPEAEGHGTDAAINAYHNRRGIISARVPIVKMITSAITLGTGGSGGREGPIAQIGAGFGSYVATRLKLSDRERRVLLAAGIGAGIGAIFHAPLAGAIFAIEVLYREVDFEPEALIPAFIATTVAYCVYSLAFGFHTLFEVEPLTFTNPLLLGPLAVLAVAMTAASYAYVKCFYGVTRLAGRLPVPKVFRPAVGAFATGAVALIAYFAMAGAGPEAQHDVLSLLSFGYGFLQKVLNPTGPLLVSVLLVVGLGKMLTTALTIGSGGSGGVFGPSMVIGGSLGALVGLLFARFTPNLVQPGDVPMFAILGMASFFAAAANAPVSTLIMVTELTGSYFLLLPAMWVCALAYLVKGKWSIYKEQVANRMASPAHRGDFVVDVLEGLTIRDAVPQMTQDFTAVALEMPLSEVAHMITQTRQSAFPVVDAEGRYYGLFSIHDVRQFLYDSQLAGLAVAQDLATQSAEPLPLNMDLSSAIAQFAQGKFEELPVVDEDAPYRVIGLLRRQDVIAAYSKRLLAMRSEAPPPPHGPTASSKLGSAVPPPTAGESAAPGRASA